MAEMADHLLERDEEYKVNNFIKDMRTAVYFRRPTPENQLWAFCCGGATDSVSHTPTSTTNQRIITEKIKYAILQYFNHTKILDHVLIQFWSPITTERGCFLGTSDQPFGLTHLDEGLLNYRKQCLEYKFNVDADGEEGVEHLGIPGRVFRKKLHECIPDVRYYTSREYPQLNFALTCGISASFAFPVFQTSFQDCVGVLEFVTNTLFRTLSTMSYSFLQLLLKDADLKSSLCHCLISWNSYEGYGITLNEICEGLKVVCRTLQLPLAQLWAPCRHYTGQVLHLQRSASYVQDDKMAGFLWFGMRNDFLNGQGVAGRAYLSRKPCFCRDITQLSLTEYPLLPGARHFGLTGCFAIHLQGTSIGKYDYILEFFLHIGNTYEEDPSTFLCLLLETMKQHFPSFKLASGEELGKELSIEFIKPHMNEEPVSFERQSNRSLFGPGVLHNGQETTQPHSSNQPLIVEVDDINNGRNVIDAEGNNTHVPCSDEANSWSDEVEVIEPGMHQEPGSFPHSSNEQLIVKVDDISNGGNVFNAEGNNTPVSFSDEANSWSDEVEIIELGMHQELGSFPHSSHQQLIVEVDDINNGRNVVNAEQNIILVSCSDEARMNQEPASFKCQSTRSPPRRGVLHNGQVTMLPHSLNQQLMVEADEINNGRNVANAEQNHIPVFFPDETLMTQEPASFQCESTRSPHAPGVLHNGQEMMQPHSSNQQLKVEVDDINNGRNVVNAEQNNILVSCSDEAHMNQELASRCQRTSSPPGPDNGQVMMQPHSSNQHNVVNPEQNDILVSCSDKANSSTSKKIRKHFGKKHEDVAQNYDVSKSTCKRICRKNGISGWPRSERNKVNDSPSRRDPPCSDLPAEKSVATVAHMTPLVTPPPDVWTITVKATYEDDMIKFQIPFSSKMVELEEEVSKRLKLNLGTYRIKYTNDDGNRVLIACDTDLRDCMSASNSLGMNTIKMFIEPITEILSNQHNVVNGEQNGILVSCSDKANSITSKEIRKHFGKKQEYVAQNYDVSESTCKRICRKNGISSWPRGKRNKVNDSPSRRDPPCSDLPAEKSVATVAHMTPLVTPPPDVWTITVKATYEDDMIKFQIPFSSRMVELEEEVSKRLKLNLGTYRIKYTNDDGDRVLIACDMDLQDCMSASMGMNTIKMFIEPVTDILSNQHNVVNAEQNDILVSCSDKANSITSKEIRKHFGKKHEDVAHNYDVSESTCKRICRKNGISGWPRSKRNKVNDSPSRRDPPCSDLPAEKSIATVAHMTPLVTPSPDVWTITIKATYEDDMIKFQMPFSSRMVELEEEVSKRLKLNLGTYRIKYTNDDGDRVLIACDTDLQDCMSAYNSLGMNTIKMFIEPLTEILSNQHNVVNAEQNDILVSCSDKANSITSKEIRKHFGKKHEDVAQNYNVSESTCKRICRKNGISSWPRGKRNKVNDSPSRRDPPCSDLSAEKSVATVAHMTPLVTPPPDVWTITVKATYEDDMIKFQIPFSSKMVELEEEVSKRLKLNLGTYRIKYTNDDGDRVLIACDTDLRDCMSAYNSLGMNTIKMFIEPITEISPST